MIDRFLNGVLLDLAVNDSELLVEPAETFYHFRFNPFFKNKFNKEALMPIPREGYIILGAVIVVVSLIGYAVASTMYYPPL